MTVFQTMMSCRNTWNWAAPGPTTPELNDLLCIRSPQNPVTMILHKLTRRANMDDLVIQSAVYILAYRILRVSTLFLQPSDQGLGLTLHKYRLFPSTETYDDVPDWLRSTEVQDNIPHPLYMDFVQFTRLRNALILGHANLDDIRVDVDNDFKRFLSVNWPSSNSLLVTDSSRNTVLHPRFVPHVCTEKNWSLDPGFARKYPNLAGLVRIRSQERSSPAHGVSP